MKDIIFIKPNNFEDTKKMVDYIIEDKILHINLTVADKKTYQRVLDFISGAMYLKEAKLLNPADKIFLSVPKDVKFKYDGDDHRGNGSLNGIVDLRYNEEEEIKPIF